MDPKELAKLKKKVDSELEAKTAFAEKAASYLSGADVDLSDQKKAEIDREKQ